VRLEGLGQRNPITRDLAACSLVDSYHCLRGIYSLQFGFIRISHLGQMKENGSVNKAVGDSDPEKGGDECVEWIQLARDRCNSCLNVMKLLP
jgi:hypothetical protein